MHVGGGKHVDMPETWDGQGDVPPGWSSHKGGVLPHPDERETAFVLAVAPDVEPKVAASGKLDSSEKATLQAFIAAAAELPQLTDSVVDKPTKEPNT